MRAQFIVRFGLAAVFLFMGVDKLRRPDIWLVQMPSQLATVGTPFIFVLGGIEIIIGLLLLTSFYQLASVGAAGILAGAIVTMGFNDISVRDFGLLTASLALFIGESGISGTDRSQLATGFLDLLRGKRR